MELLGSLGLYVLIAIYCIVFPTKMLMPIIAVHCQRRKNRNLFQNKNINLLLFLTLEMKEITTLSVVSAAQKKKPIIMEMKEITTMSVFLTAQKK